MAEKAQATQAVETPLAQKKWKRALARIWSYKQLYIMCLPAIVAVLLFNAVSHWNDWFVGEFFVTSPNLRPLQTWLRDVMKIAGDELRQSRERLAQRMKIMSGGDPDAIDKMLRLTASSVQTAGIVLTVMPVIIVYPFLQRYFIKGVLIGSLRD